MKEYHVYARLKKDSEIQFIADNFDVAIQCMARCSHLAHKWKDCTEVYIIEYDPDAHEVGKIIEQEVL